MKRTLLIEERKKLGLTQEDVAKKIGITVRQYRRLEDGTSDSTIKHWIALKELLDAESIDFLLQ